MMALHGVSALAAKASTPRWVVSGRTRTPVARATVSRATPGRVRLANVTDRSGAIPTRRATSRRGPTRARAVPPETLAAVIDPFGVSPEEWELIEGNLFGASLLPYLAFLRFLSLPECKMPPRALFGFKFLLAFVFGTIPCAIYAKLQYDDILANVDWLHGPAESLLTITNLLIVLGMREGLRNARARSDSESDSDSDAPGRRKPMDGSSVGGALLGWSAATTAGVLALAAAASGGVAEAAETVPAVGDVAAIFRHVEPANALSLPTWIIHVSSLIEWLVAMGLIWEYADVTGIRAYKGLTWGMVPCHASGIAACTFHLFYNAPTLNAVVASQAGLTVVGNATCAIAAYRIAKQTGAKGLLPWDEGFAWRMEEDEGKTIPTAEELSASPADPRDESGDAASGGALVGWENLGKAWAADSDVILVAKLLVVSAALSAAVKWGSLELDFPFEPNVWLAFALIGGPTALNMVKWNQISREEEEADASAASR